MKTAPLAQPLLPDEHNELLAAGQPGVNQISLQDQAMLHGQRERLEAERKKPPFSLPDRDPIFSAGRFFFLGGGGPLGSWLRDCQVAV